MNEAHEVENVRLSGTVLALTVAGRRHEVDLARQSGLLARATVQQRGNFELSPSGYGIHRPDLDEDLSIDGLIGIRHEAPAFGVSADPLPVARE